MAHPSLLLLLLLLLLPGLPRPAGAGEPAAAEPWVRAAELQRQHRWAEAHELLAATLARGGLSAEEEARTRLALAGFYEQQVDHPAEALRQLGAIGRLGLPADHPLTRHAEREQQRLSASEQRWSPQSKVVEESRLLAWEEERAPQQIEALRGLAAAHPDYPHLASVHYHLGVLLLATGRPGEAMDALRLALSLRPALDFNLPATQKLDEARAAWLRNLVSGAAHLALAALLLCAGPLFLLARPWHSLGLAALGRLLLVGAGGLAGLLLLAWALSRGVPPPPAGSFGAPVFFFTFTRPSGIGAEVLGPFFGYGLAGIGGALVLAVGLSRLRRRWLSALLGGASSLLLFAALLGLYWVRHLEPGGWFVPSPGAPLPELGGNVYLLVEDPDPYVLTEPRRFPGVTIDGFDEPVLVEWLTQHVPGAGTASSAEPAAAPAPAAEPAPVRDPVLDPVPDPVPDPDPAPGGPR